MYEYYQKLFDELNKDPQFKVLFLSSCLITYQPFYYSYNMGFNTLDMDPSFKALTSRPKLIYSILPITKHVIVVNSNHIVIGSLEFTIDDLKRALKILKPSLPNIIVPNKEVLA